MLEGLWEALEFMEILILCVILVTKTLLVRTLQEELYANNKSLCLTSPSLYFPFPSKNTPPSQHAGWSVHMACHVCMHWAATLSPFNKSLLVMKYLVNIIFQSMILMTKY